MLCYIQHIAVQYKLAQQASSNVNVNVVYHWGFWQLIISLQAKAINVMSSINVYYSKYYQNGEIVWNEKVEHIIYLRSAAGGIEVHLISPVTASQHFSSCLQKLEFWVVEIRIVFVNVCIYLFQIHTHIKTHAILLTRVWKHSFAYKFIYAQMFRVKVMQAFWNV